MEVNDYILKELIASEGYVLTQVENVSIDKRSVVSRVYLKEDDINKWKEIPVEEGEVLKQQIREYLDNKAAEEQSNLGA